jgi:hypothetical protein
MTIERFIANAKHDLEIATKTMPDGVAELEDYEYWGKDFVAKLVSQRNAIGPHPLAKSIARTHTRT